MAHMTLPAAHTEADCLLAERIGRTLGLEEVHVFWTLPVPPRAPGTTERTDPPGGLIGALVALGVMFERLGARMVSRD